MKLLIIALTSLSTGEVGVGLDIANQLAGAGVECSFVVEPPGEWLVAAAGYRYTVVDPRLGGEVRATMDGFVRAVRPDLIVLSDYFTYCAEMDLQFHLDPWFIDEYAIPLLPVDIYEWASTDFRAELFGDSVIEISPRITEMPVVLRPVPSAHPRQPPDAGALAYRSCRQDDRVTTATKREVFHSLGLRPGRDRMLLMPVSRWHHPLPQAIGHPWQRVTERLPELIVHHLAQLPSQVHLVIVGNPLRGFDRLPPDRVHVVPPCSPDRFSQLIGSCDTMFSFHLPSQTLMRSVFADVPAFAMRNSHPVTDAASLGRLAGRIGGLTPAVRDWLRELAGPVHTFESWPWRLASLVRPLLTDNPMTETVQRGEVLDERGFVEDLTAVLLDPGRRDELAAARDRYVRQVAGNPHRGPGIADRRRAARRPGRLTGPPGGHHRPARLSPA